MLTNEQTIDLEADLDKADLFYPQAKIVWMAMQDWPSAVDNTDELLEYLKGEMGGADLTKDNLSNYSGALGKNFGLPGNGWRAETVTGLLELFEFYPETRTLDEAMSLFCRAAEQKMKERD